MGEPQVRENNLELSILIREKYGGNIQEGICKLWDKDGGGH